MASGWSVYHERNIRAMEEGDRKEKENSSAKRYLSERCQVLVS
jgi:hypothetical protein